MRILTVITAILFLTACNTKKDKRQLLTGMYKLVIAENMDSAGVWRQDQWSKGGTGYIVYDGLGHMAVHITREGYKDYKWMEREDALKPEKINAHLDSMSVDELKAAVKEFAGSYAYAANYTIEDTADVVVHHRLTASTPAEWGTVAPRAFSFSGDTVILRVLDGNRRLKWVRMK
jgi:Lipocalin-like domain